MTFDELKEMCGRTRAVHLPFASADGGRLQVHGDIVFVRLRSSGEVIGAAVPDGVEIDWTQEVPLYDVTFMPEEVLRAVWDDQNSRNMTFDVAMREALKAQAAS